MSYILKDLKRYHKDDCTGQITLDNVSQEAAELRAQKRRSVNTPPPQQLRKVPVNVRTQSPQHSEPLRHLVGLLHSMVRLGIVAVVAFCVLLIGAYCVKEPIDYQASFHYELRNTGNVSARIAQVGDRLAEVFEGGRRNEHD